MDLREWFDADIEEILGFNLKSTSPQPAHVLNGLLYRITTGGSLDKGARAIAATKQGGGWAKTPAEARELLTAELPQTDSEFEQVREALAGLIATDRAVYWSPASFQIAHLAMVTADRTQNGIGSHAAELLVGSADLLTALVETLREEQPNPIWLIEDIVRDTGDLRSLKDGLEDSVDLHRWWLTEPACALFADELRAFLRRSLVMATSPTTDPLLGLQAVASSATLAALLAFAQVPAIVVTGSLAPLVCEACAPGDIPGMRTAAADSLSNVFGNFDRWLVERLKAKIRSDLEKDSISAAEARAYVDGASITETSGGSQKAKKRAPQILEVWASHETPIEAAAHTLRDVLMAGIGDKPARVYATIGRHCGFVGPRRASPARFRVEVSLAPALVLAGLDQSDRATVPFSLWLNRLADRFGVVFDSRPLGQGPALRASEDDHRANIESLSRLLASLGMARRYSDSVTEIVNPLYGS